MVFPKTCLGCGKEGRYLCAACLAKSKPAKPICPYCEKASIDGLTHSKCTKKFGLDGLAAVWEYEGIIRTAILALKYKYATLIGQELSEHFIVALKSPHSKLLIPDSAALVPIPLYWHRENVRGFNQSAEVGKCVAEAMSWNFIPELLVKKRQTVPQAELKGDERRSNLRDVFTFNPNYTLASKRYTLVLFDDVFTTGSTLMETAKVLKHAGAEKVWGLTIAR